jgi:hypothetical protein
VGGLQEFYLIACEVWSLQRPAHFINKPLAPFCGSISERLTGLESRLI